MRPGVAQGDGWGRKADWEQFGHFNTFYAHIDITYSPPPLFTIAYLRLVTALDGCWSVCRLLHTRIPSASYWTGRIDKQ